MWRECEVDIMYNFADLPIETREFMECVEGKPGFVKLPYDQIYLKYIKPFIPENYGRKVIGNCVTKETQNHLNEQCVLSLLQLAIIYITLMHMFQTRCPHTDCLLTCVVHCRDYNIL